MAASASALPFRSFRTRFAPVPSSARQARHWAADRLESCCSCDSAADAVLLVSELVTNAINVQQHMRLRDRRYLEVVLILFCQTLRIEVYDAASRDHPEPREPAADAENGRGLLVVGSLAACWGVRRAPDGKVVWCDLQLAKIPRDYEDSQHRAPALAGLMG